ncbi:hypothetical protein SAY87_006105 [Trapa incisa]|uniref:Uncharacterized protein n=1 Tax=Trapa incisa TaxID=236973 RepID=A0AAN7KC68_9MYRT|nr:hypothetical protein SAY87_006105 [Trapa incisa]
MAGPPDPSRGLHLSWNFLVPQLRVRRGGGRRADGVDPVGRPSAAHPPCTVGFHHREPGELPRLGGQPSQEIPSATVRGGLPVGRRGCDPAPPGSYAVPVLLS